MQLLLYSNRKQEGKDRRMKIKTNFKGKREEAFRCSSREVSLQVSWCERLNLPGRGMGNPGRGTRKGGTMTGGNAGMAAVGCGTVWGNATGSGCGPVVTVTAPAGAFTATTGVTATVWGAVTADNSSVPSGTAQTPGQDISHITYYLALILIQWYLST